VDGVWGVLNSLSSGKGDAKQAEGGKHAGCVQGRVLGC
jgi:hypothetical protein